MRKVLLLTVAVICLPGLALSQGYNAGSIDLFSDAALTSCNITVPAVGPFSVYIAQTNVGDGTIACQFKIDRPLDFIHVGDIPSYPLTLGSSEAGVSVSYGGCETGTFLILTANYFGAVTPACGLMTVVPDPNSSTGLVQFIGCSDERVTMDTAGQARLNPDGSCLCSVPVEDTTWGGIKALYQD